MEKYEALYHYFSNVKPNFWKLPPLSVSLYLKLQKLLILDFSAILGLPYFIITKLKAFHVCKIFKFDVNFVFLGSVSYDKQLYKILLENLFLFSRFSHLKSPKNVALDDFRWGMASNNMTGK